MRLILLALLLGCRPTGVGPSCADHADCADHQGCLAGTCLDATCRSSRDCAFGEHCQELTCVPGCSADRDCPAGDVCDEGTCIQAACDSTVLDCPAGTDCAGDGTCLRRQGICAPCPSGQCSGTDLCLTVDIDHAPACLPRCRDASDCPAAFTCSVLQGSGLSVCIADCGWLKGEGWL